MEHTYDSCVRNEVNLVSPADAFGTKFDRAKLEACFPSMSTVSWTRRQCNIPKHCTDQWMRLNWEIYRERARCSREKRHKDEVGWKFLTLLWHTRNGMNIDWESFNMSEPGRAPLHHSAKRPRNDGNENLNENELEFATSLSAQGPCSDGEQPTELCSECQARHMKDIDELEAKLKASKLDLDREKEDLLNLKARYERLSAKLLLDDNSGLIEFLKVRRDSNRGDVIITVSESQIFAHSIILATRSPYFKKLLRGSSETETKARARMIDLHVPLSSPVVEAIIDFCYTGVIDCSESVPPPEVLNGAHIFELAFLSKLTEAELCRGLVVDNVPQMLKLARSYSALRLQEEAEILFKENFDILCGRVFEVMEGSFPKRTG